MDGQIREIEGFYYDREKKKYFKTQSNVPAGSAYSSQDVKKRKARDAEEAEEKAEAVRQKGRIQRSKILQALVAGHLLSRELGNYGRPDIAQIYSAGLVPVPLRGTNLDLLTRRDSCILFTTVSHPDKEPSMIDVKSVMRGRVTTTLVHAEAGEIPRRDALMKRNDTSRPIAGLTASGPRPPQGNDLYTQDVFAEPGGLGDATSISAHEPSRTVAVTWLSGSAHSGVSILSPGRDAPILTLGPGRRRGQEPNVFTSTPAPPSSPFAYVLGSNYGILSIDKVLYDMHWVHSAYYPRNKGPTDIFALEFLAENHNLLLSGGRKGILNIADFRVPNTYTRPADAINHPSSISHIRQLDSHRIIVAGLNSSLCQYDLRFRKLTKPVSSPGQKRKRSVESQKITRSILQYPDFQNDSDFQIGFDVDLESGIVAAAQNSNHQSPFVRLFSLHEGHTLASPPLPSFEDNYPIKCLRFVEGIEGKMKSLYIANNTIHKFAWLPARQWFGQVVPDDE